MSAGDSRGQGALGKQLHLLVDALQPHHMVRAWEWPGGTVGDTRACCVAAGCEPRSLAGTPALPAGAGGKDCTQGLRLRPALHAVRGLAAGVGPHRRRHGRVTSSSYLQIVRLKTKDKKKQVGESRHQRALGRWAASALPHRP